MSRYLVRVAENCGMCTLGKVTSTADDPANPGFSIDVELECPDCKGTGLVDERWVDLDKLMSLAKEPVT